MKKVGVLLFGLIWLPFLAQAQDFRYQAALEKVKETGYYRIPLRPEIAGKIRPGFPDLRLSDQNGAEIPYLIRQEVPLQTQRLFREYPILKKEIKERANTTLVLRNPNKAPINNISLLIKNSNVRKKARLSGSGDRENWYALEDNYVLQSINSNNATSEVKVLDFPLSDYEYYRLVIDDSASAPLNILAAGYYDFAAGLGQYSLVPSSLLSISDSLAPRKTILHIRANSPLLIHKLVFEIDSPTFFLRNATILEKSWRKDRRGRSEVSWQTVRGFQLRSDAKNEIALPGFRSDEFYLIIENEDNPPLQIRSLNLYQLNVNLIAQLRAGKAYQLQFGNEKAVAPNYDIGFFQDKIPQELPVAEPLKLRTVEKAVNKKDFTLFTDKNIIWAAILLVIALLGFMTYRMLEETSRK